MSKAKKKPRHIDGANYAGAENVPPEVYEEFEAWYAWRQRQEDRGGCYCDACNCRKEAAKVGFIDGFHFGVLMAMSAARKGGG